MSIENLIDKLNDSLSSTGVMHTQVTDKIATLNSSTENHAVRVSEIDRLRAAFNSLFNVMVETQLDSIRMEALMLANTVNISTIPVIDRADYINSGLPGNTKVVGIDTRLHSVDIVIPESKLVELEGSTGEERNLILLIDAYGTWDKNPCRVYLGGILNGDGTTSAVYGTTDEGKSAKITCNEAGGIIGISGIMDFDGQGYVGVATKFNKQINNTPVVPQLLTAEETRDVTNQNNNVLFNTIVHADGTLQYYGIAQVDGESVLWPHVEDRYVWEEPTYRLMGTVVSGAASIDDGGHRFKPMNSIPYVQDSVYNDLYEHISTVCRYYDETDSFLTVSMYGVKYTAVPGLESASPGPGVFCALCYTRTLQKGNGELIHKDDLPSTLTRSSYIFDHINLSVPNQTAGFTVDLSYFDLSEITASNYYENTRAVVEVSAFIQPKFVLQGGFDYGTDERLHSVCSTAIVSRPTTPDLSYFQIASSNKSRWPDPLTEIIKVPASTNPIQFVISVPSITLRGDPEGIAGSNLNVAVVERDVNLIPVYKCTGAGNDPVLLEQGIYSTPSNQKVIWETGGPSKLSVTHAPVLDKLHGPGWAAPLIGGLITDSSDPHLIMTSSYVPNNLNNIDRPLDYDNQLLDNPSSDPMVSAMLAAAGTITYVDSPKIGTGWKNNTIFTGFGTSFITTLPVTVIDMVAVNTLDGGQLIVLTTNGTTKAIYVYKLDNTFSADAVSITPSIDTEISQSATGFSRAVAGDVDNKGCVLLLASDGDVILSTNNGIDKVGFSAWFAPIDRIQRTFK